MQPWIGITCGFDADEHQIRLNAPYLEAVEAAGGVPVLLAGGADLAPQLLSRLDGLLLTGGADLDPALYGAEPANGLGGVSPRRDAYEIALVREAYKAGMPTLGICRGCQLLAVAGGGTLFQDLPSERPQSMKHFQDAPRSHASHTVDLDEGSRLGELVGRKILKVNSFHHQAVRALPDGAVVTAKAPDGLVEAFEDPRLPYWLAVQWHPEGLWRQDPAAFILFRSLVQASRKTVSGGR